MVPQPESRQSRLVLERSNPNGQKARKRADFKDLQKDQKNFE